MAMQAVSPVREVDRKLAGYCGMFCGACPVYRATVDQDEARLTALAASLGVPRDEVHCMGCRGGTSFCFGGNCRVRACAESKGVDFCTECNAFPCELSYELIAGAPVRCEVLRNAYRIREIGWEPWLKEQDEHWRCRGCGAQLAYYARTCHVCGREVTSA